MLTRDCAATLSTLGAAKVRMVDTTGPSSMTRRRSVEVMILALLRPRLAWRLWQLPPWPAGRQRRHARRRAHSAHRGPTEAGSWKRSGRPAETGDVRQASCARV